MSAEHDPADDTVPIRRGDQSVAAGDDAPPTRPSAVLDPGRVTGIGRKVPVVYGARPAAWPQSQSSATLPARGAGTAAAPGADAHSPDGGRLSERSPQMPSFWRRDNRLRAVTLTAYVVTITVSLIGLCVVAFLAFG